VWKVPAAGGGAVQVTQHGGVAPLESPDGKWLYFARSGSIPTSLWKMPVAGGAETQVLEGLGYAANYDVTPGGIYYTGIENGNQDLASVRFFGFATGATREILALRKKPWSIGISVHPGGKQLLYAQTDEEGSDLMLVEGFR
jgi:Tol biopolymer transport system component